MKKLTKLILSALFAAIIAVSAITIHIPLPSGNGYLNISDTFNILAGIVLGPAYGALAAAIGGGLSDILLGFAFYAPGTAIIKALTPVTAYFVFKAFKSHKITGGAVASVLSEIHVPLLYFVYEYFILQYKLSAAGNIPFNFIQAGASAVFSALIISALVKSKLLDKIQKI